MPIKFAGLLRVTKRVIFECDGPTKACDDLKVETSKDYIYYKRTTFQYTHENSNCSFLLGHICNYNHGHREKVNFKVTQKPFQTPEPLYRKQRTKATMFEERKMSKKQCHPRETRVTAEIRQ